MQTHRGIPVSPGIAIGPVFLLEAEGVRIPEHFIAEGRQDEEVRRLQKAMDSALEELDRLVRQVSDKAGATIAEIFSAHAAALRDDYFRNEFIDRIRKDRYTAEFAVSRTMRQWRSVFQQDSFLLAKVADLDDLERRLLHSLLGAQREELASLRSEIILVAHDLSPSQTASVDPDMVKGIAIDGGGPTGHTAIIARALGIPAVVGLGSLTGDVGGGDTVIVDGVLGTVIVDPDEATLQFYRERRSEAVRADMTLLEQLRGRRAVTTDGRKFSVMANIEFPREVARACEHGAEGIGLYRTEFLYSGTDRRPTEEEHFAAYMETIRQLDGRPLVIRTVDLGADKFPDVNDIAPERNPSLGRRSVRYCLDHPEVLREQLSAVLRASAHGEVRVMFPLISGLEELLKVKRVLGELQEQFDRDGRDYDRAMKVGIMVEVPSAAVCASMLAEHVDFFSIGTNDLIQYTIAIDRANEHVADMYCPHHPAVLKLIRMTVEAAHRKGIEVGLCGEMASEVVYTMLLLGLGLDHLSVAPPIIVPELKKIVCSVSYEQARRIAEDVMTRSAVNETMDVLMEHNRALLPDLFP
ncbi:MAG: phosphoenolpyruvate--protein phosphotransferase [Candidatus Brocadiaceae bacterium]|nr:phosphoenolpyruvate--protein phosphotransferase [Candidatus Brocadiaceae bacterium]